METTTDGRDEQAAIAVRLMSAAVQERDKAIAQLKRDNYHLYRLALDMALGPLRAPDVRLAYCLSDNKDDFLGRLVGCFPDLPELHSIVAGYVLDLPSQPLPPAAVAQVQRALASPT
ncbi:hypothetical protein [Eleftheria terrae]|uniref:hypothetical protein n=1 Tax=Eleftheria terrae TaxID=1597781 RepID=UPI00263AF748|nr:hypothetical protein [Eleftheria terrae]WKB50516.1 hypothetical protein N7L95_00270 [Eleftheria terrae]